MVSIASHVFLYFHILLFVIIVFRLTQIDAILLCSPALLLLIEHKHAHVHAI